MNYHLMIDEKFIDGFITDAEKAAPGNNVYLISLYTPRLRFVKSPLVTCVTSVKRYWFASVAPKLKKDDAVFIHWLDRRVYDIILSLPSDIRVGIFSWMGDLVDTPIHLFDKEILKPESYDFFCRYKKNKFNKDTKHGVAYNFLLWGRHRWRVTTAPLEWRKKKEVMRRINLFFHWNKFDYEWVRENYPGFDATFVYFVYDVGLSDSTHSASIINSDKEEHKEVFTMWLGNSATIPNNHFEALEDMAHLKDDSIEIICPLSYGEKIDSRYTRQVLQKAKNIFGNKFHPLLEFLDRNTYYALFNRVDAVVMNHIRSQAAGNVFMFLQQGKVVFMDEHSTLYQFLLSNQVPNVYSVSQLKNYSIKDLRKLVDNRTQNIPILSILEMNLKAENLKKYLN